MYKAAFCARLPTLYHNTQIYFPRRRGEERTVIIIIIIIIIVKINSQAKINFDTRPPKLENIYIYIRYTRVIGYLYINDIDIIRLILSSKFSPEL